MGPSAPHIFLTLIAQSRPPDPLRIELFRNFTISNYSHRTWGETAISQALPVRAAGCLGRPCGPRPTGPRSRSRRAWTASRGRVRRLCQSGGNAARGCTLDGCTSFLNEEWKSVIWGVLAAPGAAQTPKIADFRHLGNLKFPPKVQPRAGHP